ncbi:replication initiator protein [Capybara microvirus Cap1_SP_244]|nr:replication initiator protein [Capybara microvirus Cap1_SP_244]
MSMNCLKPKMAIWNKETGVFKLINSDDLESIYRNSNKNYVPLKIRCGKCEPCNLLKSQDWTKRILCEMKYFKYSYFITLTYDNYHLRDINTRDIQLFIKKLRKKIDRKLKYICCGEYGSETKRPHYHMILLSDYEFVPPEWRYNDNTFVCSELEKIWQNGNVRISNDVNERCIKYTLKYTLKNVGESKVFLYSKKIGYTWFEENKEDIKNYCGFYSKNGKFENPPLYFIRKMKNSDDFNDFLWYDDFNKNRLGDTIIDFNDILASKFYEEKKKKKGKGIL